ncbi:SDR family NAD(P)-dependent oxidoreductase [Ornithinibacillus scapharcae]|uniref:SDR family NAD(P)-dependent oxidoreductase n=1 Tax=Ornithinibacillus scapharcae TaxID=1147159 RepID=UPI000225AB40|nr:SDR family NAD(P)-dependent oxidoreductase [Ornithinibacillus scapharcae]
MYFRGKHILIIGGTGTIGKSIIQTILPEMPKRISIFSRDEYKQQLLQQKLKEYDGLHYIIGDVREYDAVNSAMRNVDYVFHLAAMKHVDFSESNPLEAVKTNILGTHHVIQAAINHKVEKVIFTSSDKAISPTNAYGASKLVAERLITQANHNEFIKTVFACVRFGNVMGSRGSVIPLFKNSIVHEKRITITDPSMTRFMMTLEQATNLTIQAMKKAIGGETFVLKMPVIKIGVLADVVLEEVCKREKLDKNTIDIHEIGKRIGEKVYEELMTEEEASLAWETADMFIIPSRDVNAYPNAKKAEPVDYGTHLQTPLTKEELRSLLLSEQLL